MGHLLICPPPLAASRTDFGLFLSRKWDHDSVSLGFVPLAFQEYFPNDTLDAFFLSAFSFQPEIEASLRGLTKAVHFAAFSSDQSSAALIKSLVGFVCKSRPVPVPFYCGIFPPYLREEVRPFRKIAIQAQGSPLLFSRG